MSGKGAFSALMIFVLGIWLNLPSEINIGIMILKALQTSIQPLSYSAIPYQIAEQAIWALRIFGVIMIIGDILYIIKQIRER